MSSLWTPGGEHPVDPERSATTGPPAAAGDDDDPFAGMSDEERAQAEQMVAEMTEARERLLEMPAPDLVANHAVGLYELAAIHLNAEDPDLDAAKLAIDAMAALLRGLEGRLGETEPTLRDALSQVQLAYTQLSRPPPPD